MSPTPWLSQADGASPLARLIVAPGLGRYRPGPARAGSTVVRGDVIGVVERAAGALPVESPFSGVLGGVLAAAGEPLRDGQPVAWLHGEHLAPPEVMTGPASRPERRLAG